MKIYRRVIPRIAKDIVRMLLANQVIEVEDGRRDEAELDVAGVLVAYQDDIEAISQEARDAVQRHGLRPEAITQVKQTLADRRKVVLGKGALEYVIRRVIDGLFDSKYIEEVFAGDEELQEMVHATLSKYVGVDEELDREVRGKLKNLREGTPEWEGEYTRLIEQMRHTTPVKLAAHSRGLR